LSGTEAGVAYRPGHGELRAFIHRRAGGNRMKNIGWRWVLIRGAYWLGIGADALWAIALFVPDVFGALTGTPAFDPDSQFRRSMAVGGILMTGWTLLLIWAVREPIERRFVALLTAFPVVSGLLVLALIGVLSGNTFELWIAAKCVVLLLAFLLSYVLAGRAARGQGSP
jgi:hypothetical protein